MRSSPKGKRSVRMWGAWGSKPMATSKLRGGMAWWKGFMRAIVRPSIAMMAIRIRKERRRFLPLRERRGLRAARLVNYQEALAYLYNLSDFERGGPYTRNHEENLPRESR